MYVSTTELDRQLWQLHIPWVLACVPKFILHTNSIQYVLYIIFTICCSCSYVIRNVAVLVPSDEFYDQFNFTKRQQNVFPIVVFLCWAVPGPQVQQEAQRCGCLTSETFRLKRFCALWVYMIRNTRKQWVCYHHQHLISFTRTCRSSLNCCSFILIFCVCVCCSFNELWM